MPYSFDEIINRRGTDSLKYDFAAKRGLPENILPLWVADMDFKAPPEVLRELSEKVEHGIFGYSDTSGEDYFEVLRDWYSRRFGWDLSSSWLIKTPGVVFAIYNAVRALTREGEGVLIQQPVYYPFKSAVLDNNRKLVVNKLSYQNGKYGINLADFEEKIVHEKVKLFILCSPHNPVGRVWTKKELCAMGDICVRHGVIIVSDEIHADFVYPGHKHHVLAGLKEEYADITITCTAPTKTFNLAGLQISNIFIKNDEIRRLVKQEIRRSGYSQPNIMGLVACRSAYKYGEDWLEELKVYLSGNLTYVRDFLRDSLPQVRLIEPEGTYLIWLDCSSLSIPDTELERILTHKAGLWLDAGTMFGDGGEGFQRINIACPRATLREAMERFKTALT